MELTVKKKNIKKENNKKLLFPILIFFSFLFGISIIPNFIYNNKQFIFQPNINFNEGININFFPFENSIQIIPQDIINNIKEEKFNIINDDIIKKKQKIIFRILLFFIIVIITVLMIILIIEKNNNRILMRRLNNNYLVNEQNV